MLRLFKSKEEKELDALLERVDNNMSNNYKDAAQKDYKNFLKRYDELASAGKLSDKVTAYYTGVIEEYASKLTKFTHKDQPTKWGDWK
ncbi:MAG: hypothetical protein IKP92_07010 [Lachnospiraceae bacterium]|nr:hypothetical protein [Lachnospiraceae bacterium]